MNRTIQLMLPALFAVLLNACGGSKSAASTDAPKPAETYTAVEEKPVPSTITIPVNISIQDLVGTLNGKMPGVLYEDLSYSDNNTDNLMLKAVKSQDLTLHFSGNTIKYRLPVKLWLKQNLLVTEAEAQGELALNLKTTFKLNADWTLGTQTEVEYHEWLARPVLKTGLGNISLETVANLVLNRSKKTLAQTLDRTVSQQLSLRPYIEDVWQALQEPTLLSEEYQMWVKTTPLSIGMTPITTDWNNIKAKIAVETLNDVHFGAKPSFRQNAPLPNLTLLDDAPDEFQMRIATDVPFAEAERLARTTMVGQEFASGKRKVKVEDIKIWGNNDKIVVNSRLSGSFRGDIYFIGRPVYNAAKNQVEVADLDFHVDTKNFLFRSASWIFQGTIRRKMAEAMAFPLEENMTALKGSIQETLNRYELQPGVVLTGTIDQVSVENTRVTKDGILVNLFGKGKLQVDVKGL